MDQFISFLKDQVKRPLTTPLLIAAGISLLIALILGISANPPGVAFMYLSATLLCASLVHHWQKPRHYGTLFAVAVISFPVLALIHNIFELLNGKIGSIIFINQMFDGISVIGFIGAVVLSPAAALVGMFMGLYYLLKDRTS